VRFPFLRPDDDPDGGRIGAGVNRDDLRRTEMTVEYGENSGYRFGPMNQGRLGRSI
jgi:hypothetical protein